MKRICSLAAGAALTAGLMVGAAAGSAKGNAATGKAEFQAACAACHNAETTAKKMGPSLKGLFRKEKMGDGKKPTEANVRAKIDQGGNGMPPYKDQFSDQNKKDLIAYLETL